MTVTAVTIVYCEHYLVLLLAAIIIIISIYYNMVRNHNKTMYTLK